MPLILALVITVLVAALAALTGLTEWLQAHPWWAQQVVWIGAPIGIGAGLALWALRAPRWLRLGLPLALLVGAFALARYGHDAFAASFAEDRLAGRLWYFGWIATAAAFAATLIGAAHGRTTRHQ